jgi:hypothetical protein
MIILNSFPLLGPIIFSNDALAAESDQLCELYQLCELKD